MVTISHVTVSSQSNTFLSSLLNRGHVSLAVFFLNDVNGS